NDHHARSGSSRRSPWIATSHDDKRAGSSRPIRGSVASPISCFWRRPARARRSGLLPHRRIEILPIAEVTGMQMAFDPHPFAEGDQVGRVKFLGRYQVEWMDMMHFEVQGAPAIAAPALRFQVRGADFRPFIAAFGPMQREPFPDLVDWIAHKSKTRAGFLASLLSKSKVSCFRRG